MSSMAKILRMLLFLSTPSARRATQCAMSYITTINISIHALREEGDARTDTRDATTIAFLSTPSARRATRHKRYDRS